MESKSEILSISTNAKETGNKNSSELIEREHIEGTPFVIVTTEEGSFLTMGRYKVTETLKTKAEVKKLVKAKDWELLLTVVSIMTQEVTELLNKK